MVGYAHLDTEWRWEYPQVIDEYLKDTLLRNFGLFEKYPHYVFNFTGSNRYRFMKEYYPADFAKVKKYVEAGRWFPAGSSVEEGDVNAPSAEGIIRQVLYGNNWFRKELGKASAEYMLPDCFGFPASLPSILAHAGVKGFSTQKLTWGSSAPGGGPDSVEKTPEGIPFNVGVWVGPDGKSVMAALNPGDYTGQVTTDLSQPLPLPRRAWPDLTRPRRNCRRARSRRSTVGCASRCSAAIRATGRRAWSGTARPRRVRRLPLLRHRRHRRRSQRGFRQDAGGHRRPRAAAWATVRCTWFRPPPINCSST